MSNIPNRNDLQDRLDELVKLKDAFDDDNNREAFTQDDEEELAELQEIESSGFFDSKESLIPEDGFVRYLQERLEDNGEIPWNLPRYIVIDWEETANNIGVDYTTVTYLGESYLFRDC